MTRDEALEILRASLAKAKRFGQLCEVDERTMGEAIAALSSLCAMTKMGIARRLTAIKASIESCKAADDFYEKHRSNALQGISDFFNALEQEGKPE